MEIKKIYPLSPLQLGMLFHHIEDPNSQAYFEQTVYELNGELDINLINISYNKLIERYDIFRTVFIYQDVEKPIQVVVKERSLDVKFVDFSKLHIEKKKQELHKYSCENRNIGFDLSKDILFQLTVIQKENESYWIILEFHHIIMDGWCLGLILQELFQIYYSLKKSIKLNLSNVVPYSNFIDWIGKQNKQNGLNFWKDYLNGYEGVGNLPLLKNNDTNEPLNPKEITLELDEQYSLEIEKIAKENSVTTNTFFQSLWGIVLQNYNNTNDVVFGVVVSGRPSEIKGIERMVGLCINTIPCRVKSNNDQTFLEVLLENQAKSNDAKAYEYLLLSEIKTYSNVKGEFINHIMVYENYPIINNEYLQENKADFDLRANKIKTYEQTNYNFWIAIVPGKNYKIRFNYDLKYYNTEFIESLASQLKAVIKKIVNDVNCKIQNIDFITESEKQRLLYEFNNTEKDISKVKNIIDLFDDQVNVNPYYEALEFNGIKLTYHEFALKTDLLASVLINKGVKENKVVPIMVNRSIEMLVGIFGILKAGGVYLPISPKDPKDRINYILNDCKSEILLTTQKDSKGIIIKVDTLYLENEIEHKENINIKKDSKQTTRNRLEYIIYTSGTTGRPKGAMIESRSLVNRLSWMKNYYNVSSDDIFIQKTPYTFDVSVWELLLWAICGSKLILLEPEAEKEPRKIIKAIADSKVSIIHFVPSMLKTFLIVLESDFGNNTEELLFLRHVICSGEALRKEDVLKFNELFKFNKQINISNLYGPTEATIDVTYYDCKDVDKSRTIPIGKPIDNTAIYILSKNLKLSAIGVIGELCIGGIGLARGYMNKSELDNEKFILNPFKNNERIYRTGDLARWLPDGNIEYIGRVDEQVKIRGFRIELGEIENVLLSFNNVKECIVLAMEENDDKFLCAYLVCAENFNQEKLREYLLESLPYYMIPSYFVEMDGLPLTNHGKVDRQKLPTPEIKAGEDYIKPSNEIEEKLAEIWSKVLNIAQEEISVTSNFFNLGGHSLKAILLVGSIHKEIGVEFSLKDIFLNGTIKQQANYIKSSDEKLFISVLKTEKKTNYSMSSAQKRIYLLQQIDLTSTAYNMPIIISLGKEADKLKIEEVFKQLINRHESFRTSIIIVDGEAVQLISRDVEFEFEELSIESTEIETTRNNFIKPFDLSKAPFLRAAIVDIKGEDSLLMIDMHHIISDGTSQKILKEEFESLYSGEELPSLNLQYKDYSEWQNTEKQQFEIREQEEYWLNEFVKEFSGLNLPTDYVRPVVQNFEGSSISFYLNENETKELIKIARESDSTLFIVLLAVFNIFLSKLSGQEDITIGTSVSGRRHNDLQNVIGMFVNMLPLRNFPEGQKSFDSFLKDVRNKAISAFENQDYQFDDLVNILGIKRDISHNPIFDVIINFLNQNQAQLNDYTDELIYGKLIKVHFDITFTCVEFEKNLFISIDYCSKLFKQQTIEKYAYYLKEIISKIIESPNRKLEEIKFTHKYTEVNTNINLDDGFNI
ncbi:MAG: amino acid adenylation domain-containing protein [Bacteroidales bacterium]|nr:amino acid adenylation domain-containing protein [Bacteroidales bacterium]